jgi:hypothetical protein
LLCARSVKIPVRSRGKMRITNYVWDSSGIMLTNNGWQWFLQQGLRKSSSCIEWRQWLTVCSARGRLRLRLVSGATIYSKMASSKAAMRHY